MSERQFILAGTCGLSIVSEVFRQWPREFWVSNHNCGLIHFVLFDS